jgi:hypothetical protein
MAGDNPTTTDNEFENLFWKDEFEDLLWENARLQKRLDSIRKAIAREGRLPEMSPKLTAFMVYTVDQRPHRPNGKRVSVSKAVADFLQTMAAGHFFASRGLLPDSSNEEVETAKTEFLRIWTKGGPALAKLMDGLACQGTAEQTYYRERDYYRRKAAYIRWLVNQYGDGTTEYPASA